MAYDIPDHPVMIPMTRDEAESLSLSLSDLLCWLDGFRAARIGTPYDDHHPMGVEAVRTINLKLKTVF